VTSILLRTHDDCSICDHLAREAERTAAVDRLTHRTTTDHHPDGTLHAAHWLADTSTKEKTR
jgi:hypothetical protein